MKKIFFISVLALLQLITFGQSFTFKCTYKKNSVLQPCYLVPPDNVFNMYYHITTIKDSDSSFHITLMPSSIAFFKIGGGAVLISPDDHTEGYFGASHGDYEPYDTNSINFTLTRISRGFSNLVNTYGIGSDFEKFKSVVHLLNEYMDSTNATLNNKNKPWLNGMVIFALKEYESTRLAHFLVLPVLFKNNYDEKELKRIIRKNIQIREPQYWLQLEPGRIFLHTYYQKICLPDANFNLQKSLGDQLFTSPLIHKLLTYDYFTECMERANVKTKRQLSDDWLQSKPTLALSNEEEADMGEVYTKIKNIGENISDVFTTLPLMNLEGKMLSKGEKQKLIAGKNIIFDFWASWCIPCREKMNKLNSDHVTLNHQQYKIIYLSLDQDEAKWKAAHFPFLNKTNSFRIRDGDNQFVKDFNIQSIPRYMLTDQSALISSKFSFE